MGPPGRGKETPLQAVLIILPDGRKLQDLLAAMKAAGAPGATVFDGQGQEFLAWYGGHPSLARHWSLEGVDREAGKAVLSMVPDALVDAVVGACDHVLDGFSRPFSGMLCTWPIGQFRCFQGDKPKAAVAALAAEGLAVRA
jgi:hypothetical protein